MRIKVENIKDNEDGSCDLEISYGKDFEELVKQQYNRKRVTKKLIKKAVIDGLTNYIEQNK